VLIFRPFNEAIVTSAFYEYELNVPLPVAALGACVEDRHIADLYRLWTKATTFCSVWAINPENLMALLSFAVTGIVLRGADMTLSS